MVASVELARGKGDLLSLSLCVCMCMCCGMLSFTCVVVWGGNIHVSGRPCGSGKIVPGCCCSFFFFCFFLPSGVGERKRGERRGGISICAGCGGGRCMYFALRPGEYVLAWCVLFVLFFPCVI